ncbi:MAG: MoxR family ATPase [Mycobacteriales bacterium]
MKLTEVTSNAAAILDEVERAVVGKRPALELMLAGLLANGHVLLEDVPGLGKTLIAWSFAQVTGLDFARVQFTPDLMPSDIVGSSVFDQRTMDFAFRRGPVFNNLMLADEINRASPKTQAALLEAMQERQVSIDGTTHQLQRPFLVMATQNPVEYEGTYPLPEAQLDRFLLRISLGYPDRDGEVEVLGRRLERRQDAVDLEQIVDRATFLAMQEAIESVHVDRSLRYYMVDLVAATRGHDSVQVGASPRGSLALVMASRAHAVVGGRDFVTPDDVKRVAVAALGHRIVLKPAQWVRGATGDNVVRDVLNSVPTPAHQLDATP